MPERLPVVVDTNIVFSALLNRSSAFADLLMTSDYHFYVCELVVVELFKQKDKLIRASRLSEDEIVRVLYTLLRHLHLYKEDLIAPENRKTAYALCRDIDEQDTPHVALTLELKGVLWSGDKKLKEGLRKKGFTQFFDPNPTGAEKAE